MADLYVRSGVLDGLRSRLSTISMRLHGACDALGRLDGPVVGAPPLVEAVDEFAEQWRYGITRIGECTEAAVHALGTIGRSFDECDATLARACRPGGADDAA